MGLRRRAHSICGSRTIKNDKTSAIQASSLATSSVKSRIATWTPFIDPRGVGTRPRGCSATNRISRGRARAVMAEGARRPNSHPEEVKWLR
jgi:hypothetical protein